jgi:hypothetical protein
MGFFPRAGINSLPQNLLLDAVVDWMGYELGSEHTGGFG